MSSQRFIQSFTKVPKELFRMSTGGPIRLKAYPGRERPQRKFDILTSAGKVQPMALDPDSYEWPNGAGQQRIVNSYTGPNISIYSIPAALETKINDFLHAKGRRYSKEEWLRRYSRAVR
ncbi:hypothetical protein N7540_006547 [Penicillium herquei]|nr:hypothetical protein N7540_006547 [Penicillium herquei]